MEGLLKAWEFDTEALRYVLPACFCCFLVTVSGLANLEVGARAWCLVERKPLPRRSPGMKITVVTPLALDPFCTNDQRDRFGALCRLPVMGCKLWIMEIERGLAKLSQFECEASRWAPSPSAGCAAGQRPSLSAERRQRGRLRVHDVAAGLGVVHDAALKHQV